MYYRVTILKGKPEMAEKGYALLDENRAKLEAMPGIEQFGCLKQMMTHRSLSLAMSHRKLVKQLQPLPMKYSVPWEK